MFTVRRREIFAFVSALVIFALYGTSSSVLDAQLLEHADPIDLTGIGEEAQYDLHADPPSTPQVVDDWDTSRYVLGPPTTKFRDNLVPDVNYITTWNLGGFSNLFMGMTNMIYIGMITERVPVCPPFAPSHHISAETPPVRFGDIFDLDHFRKTLRTPILEWADLKIPLDSHSDPSALEPLGCWSSVPRSDVHPVISTPMHAHLGLDVAFSRMPGQVYRDPSNEGNIFVLTWQLAALIFPETEELRPYSRDSVWTVTPVNHLQVKPDAQVACIDSLYYMGNGVEDFEWQHPWGAAWRMVGKHLRFTRKTQQLAEEYAGRALDVPRDRLPPFITVHVRRGDFVDWCAFHDYKAEDCFAPISTFARRVQEVRNEIRERSNVDVTEVIISSDTEDAKFWEDVKALGWRYVDHAKEQTLEKYGEWYAPVIDIAIQGMGLGFVGTDRSTLSLVSQRRVQDWNKGSTRMVKWGTPGVDELQK